MVQRDKSIFRRVEELEAGSVPGFSGSYLDLTDVPSTFAPSAHGHSIAEVAGLQLALDSKLEAGIAAISDIVGLQAELDSKLESGTATIADISGLQAELDSKLESGTAVIADIVGLQAALNGKLDTVDHRPQLLYANRAAAQAASVPAGVDLIAVIVDASAADNHIGFVVRYVRDPNGTALTTSGGDTWSPEGKATVAHYGAVNDASQFSDVAFNAAIAAHDVVFINKTPDIPALTSGFPGYRIRNTVNMRQGVRLFGDGILTTTIRSHSTLGDAPTIGRPDWNSGTADNDPGVGEIVLSDFQIIDNNAPRVAQWTIDLTNATNNRFYRLRIGGGSGATTPNGIYVGRRDGGTYPNSSSWVHRIEQCQMSAAKIFLNASDSRIALNELYSFGKDYCIRLGHSANQVIGNFVSGGDSIAGVYIEGDTFHSGAITSTFIHSNHMDGTAGERNCMRFLYAPSTQQVQGLTAVQNSGYNHGMEAIRLENAHGCVLASNTGYGADQFDAGLPDIYIEGEDNIVKGNYFERDANSVKASYPSVVARINLGRSIQMIDTAGASGTCIAVENRHSGAGYATSAQADEWNQREFGPIGTGQTSGTGAWKATVDATKVRLQRNDGLGILELGDWTLGMTTHLQLDGNVRIAEDGAPVIPAYSSVDLADITHPVNTTDKYLGKTVYKNNTAPRLLYTATGGAAGSLWSPSDGSGAITPV